MPSYPSRRPTSSRRLALPWWCAHTRRAHPARHPPQAVVAMVVRGVVSPTRHKGQNPLLQSVYILLRALLLRCLHQRGTQDLTSSHLPSDLSSPSSFDPNMLSFGADTLVQPVHAPAFNFCSIQTRLRHSRNLHSPQPPKYLWCTPTFGNGYPIRPIPHACRFVLNEHKSLLSSQLPTGGSCVSPG
jgi:hypothetical protein